MHQEMNEATGPRFRARRGRARRAIPAALLALFIAVAPAAAQPAAIAGEELALLAAPAPGGKGPLLFGLRMTMRKGWHTYWRKPGDSGIAPRFDWSASENAAEVILLWPAPQRFDAEGDMTVGYEGEVIWPLLVRAADPKKPVTLDLKMSYGVCSDICVPGEAHLTRSRAPGEKTDEGEGAALRAALARVPVAPARAEDVSARLDGKVLRVTLREAAETPALILEGPRGVWFGKPQAARRGRALDYAVPVGIEGEAKLEGERVTLTFSGPPTAIEARRKIE
jgi:DsbC/DsbD-like thiol-disulfide interchange protein